MEHWETTDEVKTAAKRRRRLNDKREVTEQENEAGDLSDPPASTQD